ncbi:hypothetical protein SKAU_G00168660 [Synaphobranchus kaupii]|uniref:Uncharacterized protein n=1 Tax=Synaphobranchus kaupii TaxID=118154 RepID=A0A9Q1FK39_SYNKA|nr:hypothetical protein SKAU_G00168660 [Synaphobranchus kaupii]
MVDETTDGSNAAQMSFVLRWNFNLRLVGTVFEQRVELIKVFDHIIDHADEFDTEYPLCSGTRLTAEKL